MHAEAMEQVTAEELAAYVDAARPEDLRSFLAEANDVETTMGCLDRIGYRFYWYQRDPDADSRVWNKTGLSLTHAFADPGSPVYAKYPEWKPIDDEWSPRIKAHCREMAVLRHGEPIPTGFHQVRYRLTAPGGYLHDWERQTDAAN